MSKLKNSTQWHYFNINKCSQPAQIKLSHEMKTDIFIIILLYRENNTIFWSVERKENVKNILKYEKVKGS